MLVGRGASVAVRTSVGVRVLKNRREKAGVGVALEVGFASTVRVTTAIAATIKTPSAAKIMTRRDIFICAF